ncbi:rhodanese-like domain-containing protein [Pseudonocardiaceae bacterium YIM PH 21723]|nr:rhodanese-like domain-containing protein [Pseudonocardiaceae bacterium YIM PH 21723]
MLTSTDFFAARLEFQTDVSDVHAAMESGEPGFVLLDTRNAQAWTQGRIPGAVRLETADLDPAVPVVTYCWGPGCNGATKAALDLARRGFQVREMLGGIEYWIREGLPVDTDDGTVRRPADPLTAPPGFACAC